MTNLVIDPYQHSPSLYYVSNTWKPTLYFSDPERINKEEYLWGYYNNKELHDLYHINGYSLSKDSISLEVDNLLIQIPLTDGSIYENKTNYCVDYYEKILSKTNVRQNVYVFDTSDYSEPVTDILDKLKLKPNKIFKKCMSSRFNYPKEFIPFVYFHEVKYDQLYYLNHNRFDREKIHNKIFWAGAPIYGEKLDTKEPYSRKQWIENCRDIIFSAEKLQSKDPLETNYTAVCPSYKYAAYLKGPNNTTRRLLEILRSGALMLIERSSALWGDDIKFHDLCYFSTEEELRNNYQKLETDVSIYNAAKALQETIVQSYFSYNHISSMIFSQTK